MREIVLFLASLLLVIALGFPVEAKGRHHRAATVDRPLDEQRDKLIDTCPYVTVDGSQVSQGMWTDGKCLGNPKINRIVAQIVPFKALCFRRSLTCLSWSKIKEDPDWLTLYDRMVAVSKSPASDAKVCTTRNHRWARFLVTRGDAPCAPAFNDAYEIDFDAKLGCVYLGSGLMIGCVSLTPQEYEAAWGEHQQVVARLEAEKAEQERQIAQRAQAKQRKTAQRVHHRK